MTSQVGNERKSWLLRQETHSVELPRSSLVEFTHQGRSYELDCLHRPGQLAALEVEWTGLHQLGDQSFTYFQSFDWCSNWAENFCSQSDDCLRIFVLREKTHSGRAILIWPMVAVRSRSGVRVLVSLSDPLGQYSSLIVDQEQVNVSLAQTVLHHIKTTSGCDAIAITNCPLGSFMQAVVDGLGMVENTRPVSSMLDLTQFNNWDEYHASFPGKIRKLRRKRLNKLKTLGELEYHVEPGGTPAYQELVRKCLQYKQDWLRETARRSPVLADPMTEKFLQSLGAERESGKVQSLSLIHI